MMDKRRIAVLIVAAGLVLAGVTDSAAHQQTDSETVSVELDNPLCAVELYVTEGTFGHWDWDGDSWEKTGVEYEHTFQADLDPIPFGGCDLTVTFGGLANAASDVIDANHFSAEYPAGLPVTSPASWRLSAVKVAEIEFSYTLESVPSDVPPGRYEGDITVTVSNAA